MTIAQEIRKYLEENWEDDDGHWLFANDAKELGIESREVVNLAVWLEERFEIEITPADVENGDFYSITKIAKLVDKRRR